MLSPKTLERAGAAYTRGYYAGHAGESNVNPYRVDSFAHTDFASGHAAGVNDAYWAAKRTEENNARFEAFLNEAHFAEQMADADAEAYGTR
jgi:hypothetical protein